MAEEAPHILNITQQLQSSLNFYLLLKQRYAQNQRFKSNTLEKAYFENILKALKTSEDSNLAEQFKEAEQQEDPQAKAGMIAQVNLEKQQLEIIRDLIEMINK